MKKILGLILTLTLCIMSFSCNNTNSSVNATENNQTQDDFTEETETEIEEKEYNIGVIQLIQHEALDRTYQGFVDYLNEKNIKVDIDYQNASGEQSACQTIAEKFASDNLDLCYAISTPAAQSVVAHLDQVPIVAAAVTDPVSAGICQSNDKPGGNITVASDMSPIDAQFDLLKELVPSAKTVGILYCSAEPNSKIQAEQAKKIAKEKNLIANEYTVVTFNDIQTVVDGMVGKVDVIYIPTDNIIAAGMDTVATICNDNKIPTIVGEPELVDKGGLATYGIDYYVLGKKAGEMAEEILVNGKNPGDIPVFFFDKQNCVKKINKQTANILGISIEDEDAS